MHFWSTYYEVGTQLVEVNAAAGTNNNQIYAAIKSPGGVHYEIWDKACAS